MTFQMPSAEFISWKKKLEAELSELLISSSRKIKPWPKMDLQLQKSAQVDINVSIFVALQAFCSEGKRPPF